MTTTTTPLRNARALVTGATSGIGRRIALELGRQGAEVIVHGTDPAAGATTVTAIEADGGFARFVAADLADRAGVARLVGLAGDLDILVNSARDVPAPHLLVASITPQLTRRGEASIVNVGDVAAEIGSEVDPARVRVRNLTSAASAEEIAALARDLASPVTDEYAVAATPSHAAAGGPTSAPWRMPKRVAFFVQISILVLLLAASSAPTPLYSVYQAEWGFSAITTTVVFGIYALAVLGALLTVGSLSDHVGRRPVLIGALLLQIAALAVFATAGDVTALVVARIAQGLSTGAAAGALGAALIDLRPTTGTLANGVSPIMGTATGALVSGVLVQYLPSPTHLVFVALLVAFVIETVAVVLMPETSSPKAGALASLRPQLGLPRVARARMLVAIPALVAVWSLAGFYASLGPKLVLTLSGSGSFVLGSLSLAVLAGVAALTVLLVRNVDPRRVLLLGALALVVGAGAAWLAVNAGSTIGFFIATTVAGVGFGAGFQGGLRTVLPLARPHERAGVLSAIYIVSYLAFGLPAVGAGFLVEHVGVLSTARDYAAVAMVLAALALLGLLSRREERVLTEVMEGTAPEPRAAVRTGTPIAAR